MPTYDYKCDNCAHQFEVYQSMKDEKLTTCPNCGKNTLKRLIGSGGGLIFKGSGFYLTDYKNKQPEKAPVSTSGTETKIAAQASTSNKSPDTNSKTSADSGTAKTEKTTSKKKSDEK